MPRNTLRHIRPTVRTYCQMQGIAYWETELLNSWLDVLVAACVSLLFLRERAPSGTCCAGPWSASFVRCGIRRRSAPSKREPASGRRRKIQHPLREARPKPSIDDQHRHVVSTNDRVARVWDIDRHSQVASLVQAQPHSLLRSCEVVGQEPLKLRGCTLGHLNHRYLLLSAFRLDGCKRNPCRGGYCSLTASERRAAGSIAARP